MKRFFAALMLASGLLVAGGAKAAFLGNFNADCNISNSANIVTGSVGDTFSVTTGLGLCSFSNGAGVVTGPASINGFGNVGTYTLAAQGTTAATWLQNGTGLTLTVTVSAPSAVPTLSKWSQLMLAFLLMSAMVYYRRRHPIKRP